MKLNRKRIYTFPVKNEIYLDSAEESSKSVSPLHVQNQQNKTKLQTKAKGNSFDLRIQASENYQYQTTRELVKNIVSNFEQEKQSPLHFLPPTKKVEDLLALPKNPPRRGSCGERKSLLIHKEDWKERRLEKARTPSGRYLNNPRLNRIKVLSPLPPRNPNCFSPPLDRIPLDSRTNLDLSTFNLHSFDEKAQNLNSSLHPILRNFSRQKSVQENNSFVEERIGSPNYINESYLFLSTKEPNTATTSPTHLREMRARLPFILHPKKCDSTPVRAGTTVQKQQSEDKWNYYKGDKSGDILISLQAKANSALTRPSTDDSPNSFGRFGVGSRGFETQRSGFSSRFRAEEMILNKLFKPVGIEKF